MPPATGRCTPVRRRGLLPKGFLAALLLLLPALPRGADSLRIDIGRIEAGGHGLSDVSLLLAGFGRGTGELVVGEARLAGRTWRGLRVHCRPLEWRGDAVSCPAGELLVPAREKGGKAERIPLRFSYHVSASRLELELALAGGESWRVESAGEKGGRFLRLDLQQARLERAAALLPDLARWRMRGAVSGTATWRPAPAGDRLEVAMRASGLAFSNAEGTRAGENIALDVSLSAVRRQGRWQAELEADWPRGEAYVQPFYHASTGAKLTARGAWDGQRVQLGAARVSVAGIGAVDLDGEIDAAGGRIERLAFATESLDLARVGASVLAPLLEQAGAPKLEFAGRVRMAGRIAAGEAVALDLSLEDAALREAEGRYAVTGIRGRVPWSRDAATEGSLALEEVRWGKLAAGPARLPLRLEGYSLAMPRTEAPLLDGKVVLEDVRFARRDGASDWQAALAVEPVSMERLSQALGLPPMSGTFSASLPGVRQEGSTISLAGALVIQVFGGFASVTDLRMIEPFGRLPRVYADAQVRNLDLGQLTRAFSFGSITGRLDGDLKGLELAGARPLRFDARFASSPGDYRKRISQRAVQNISALGGAGAAAAIQRSLLRVFEEFGYGKLGWTCVLRDGVCEMGGVEDAPQGYVLVKGAGIPAINVIGYNRRVDWDELLSRLKRITESNTGPVIQ